eukprot:TRINITY_DN6702_c0_g1_i1.p1 TRINITY_DN6702_c0_g1~~TRINITY_DN6702_c0_g1_i1.p1  ORF type:complete len:313 (+),score=54.63 TRINITY_DN6702_c0_g1_i1:55-993(+)
MRSPSQKRSRSGSGSSGSSSPCLPPRRRRTTAASDSSSSSSSIYSGSTSTASESNVRLPGPRHRPWDTGPEMTERRARFFSLAVGDTQAVARQAKSDYLARLRSLDAEPIPPLDNVLGELKGDRPGDLDVLRKQDSALRQYLLEPCGGGPSRYERWYADGRARVWAAAHGYNPGVGLPMATGDGCGEYLWLHLARLESRLADAWDRDWRVRCGEPARDAFGVGPDSPCAPLCCLYLRGRELVESDAAAALLDCAHRQRREQLVVLHSAGAAPEKRTLRNRRCHRSCSQSTGRSCSKTFWSAARRRSTAAGGC